MGSNQLDAQFPDLLVQWDDHFLRQEQQIKGPAEIHPPIAEWLFRRKLSQLLHEPVGDEVLVWDYLCGPRLEPWREIVAKERPQARRSRRRQRLGRMVGRVGHVGVVDHEGGPGVDGLETATELAPEYVFGRVADALQVAFGYVVEQRVIGKSALQLRLPDVVVGVDEARRDNLACAVDRPGARAGGRDGGRDLPDNVPFDQDIGVL